MEQEKRKLISIKEARKSMGKVSTSFTDAMVESIIQQLEFVSEMVGREAHERIFKKSVRDSPMGSCTSRSVSQNNSKG
jgi:hypothetical protein